MHFMYQNGGLSGMEFLGMDMFSPFGILPLLLWVLAWKGWALWLAARRGETVWFAVLLVVNTFGLLEIFYIFTIAKRGNINRIEEKSTKSTPVAQEKIINSY